MAKNDGGPVFPQNRGGITEPALGVTFCPGLSLRAYVSGQFGMGLVSQYKLNRPEDQQILAQMAVQLADALIVELNKDG